MIGVEVKGQPFGPHIDQLARDALDDFGLIVSQANWPGSAAIDIKEVVGE